MNKVFRKIHLWLSVPFGIFITLICFAGAMLVFEKEITEWCRPDLYFVSEVKERPLPLDSLMRRVAATLPDSVEVTGVTVSPDAGRTYQVSLSKPRRASIYVDQYTGEVKGRNERLPFFDTMFHLHRWLLGASQSAGGGMSVGKLLVGVSTLVLVIILLTGVVIWWPRSRKALKNRLTISVTKGWHRFWYDLHVSGGIYATIFLLALALTGLTWSFSWYRTGFYGMFGVEASAGGGQHGGGRDGGMREGGRGEHGDRGGHGRHGGRPDGKRPEGDGTRAGRDSVAAGQEPRHEGRRDAEPRQRRDRGNAAPESGKEVKEAGKKAPETAPAQIPAREQESGSDVAAAQDERAGRHHGEDGGDETGEHRGRHGRGGRGRHHHESDSTGGYAGRHGGRPDSLQAHDAASDVAVSRAGRETDGQAAAAVRERPAREGRRDMARTERRDGSRKGRGAKAEVRETMLADTLASDTVAAPVVLPFAHWQEVCDALAKSNPGYRQITVADGSATVVPEGRNSLRSGDRYDFDAATGAITGSKPYSEQDKSAKVRSAVYTVHVGSWGGMFTRILTFIVALLGAALPLTGYYLWIRRLMRKPSGRRKTE